MVRGDKDTIYFVGVSGQAPHWITRLDVRPWEVPDENVACLVSGGELVIADEGD